MAVLAVLAASTSPAKAPPVIATVALASVMPSGSLTDAVGARVTAAPFSVKDTLPAPASVGASLIAVTPMVVVAVAMVLLALPSLIVQVTVRVGLEPKFVGLWLGVTKVTLSRAAW